MREGNISIMWGSHIELQGEREQSEQWHGDNMMSLFLSGAPAPPSGKS